MPRWGSARTVHSVGSPKIPDTDEVVSLLNAGKSNAEVRKFLLDKYDVAVSSAAISNLRRRYATEHERVRSSLIPWQVQEQHRNLWAPRMLRALSRQRANAPLAPTEAHHLELWLARLEDGDLAGCVVHYEPALGFMYVPRREGDRDVIAVPDPEAVAS